MKPVRRLLIFRRTNRYRYRRDNFIPRSAYNCSFWSASEKEATELIDGLVSPTEVELEDSIIVFSLRYTQLHTILVIISNPPYNLYI
jgi:hypothetical protein